MGVVWGRIGQRGVCRNIVKAKSSRKRCGKARTVGTSLPYLQNLQSNGGPAASLLYSWLPREGKQGIIVPTPPALPGLLWRQAGGFGFFCLLFKGHFVQWGELRPGVRTHRQQGWRGGSQPLQELVRKASRAYKKIWKKGWGKGKGAGRDNGTVLQPPIGKSAGSPRTKGKGVVIRTVTGKESTCHL